MSGPQISQIHAAEGISSPTSNHLRKSADNLCSGWGRCRLPAQRLNRHPDSTLIRQRDAFVQFQRSGNHGSRQVGSHVGTYIVVFSPPAMTLPWFLAPLFAGVVGTTGSAASVGASPDSGIDDVAFSLSGQDRPAESFAHVAGNRGSSMAHPAFPLTDATPAELPSVSVRFEARATG